MLLLHLLRESVASMAMMLMNDESADGESMPSPMMMLMLVMLMMLMMHWNQCYPG
jgi:hypothetical protein